MSLVLLLEFQKQLEGSTGLIIGIKKEIASIAENTAPEDLTALFEQFALKRRNATIFLSNNIHTLSSYDLKTSQVELPTKNYSPLWKPWMPMWLRPEIASSRGSVSALVSMPARKS